MEYPAIFRYDTAKAWRSHWLGVAALMIMGTFYTLRGFPDPDWIYGLLLPFGVVATGMFVRRLHLQTSQVLLLEDRIVVDAPFMPKRDVLYREVQAIEVHSSRKEGIDLWSKGRKLHIGGDVDRFEVLRDEVMSRVSVKPGIHNAGASLPSP